MPDGSFIAPQVSPDGRRVVFTQRNLASGLSELYSVSVSGGEPPVKLSPSDGRVVDVLISPDSTRVVYVAGIPGPGSTLFSVPIAGPASASVRLSSDIGGNTPAISPNGRLVVHQTTRRDRIRAVPIGGPANAGTRLTQPIEVGREIHRFHISPDGKSVVYMANQDAADTMELYRVPLTLSPQPQRPTAKLNARLVGGGQVRDFWISPLNAPVVYLADQETLDVPELYAVRLGGGGRVKLSLPLPPNWEVGASTIEDGVPVRISPDGSRVAYQIQEKAFEGRADVALYSVPITGPGTDSVRLDDPRSSNPDARSLFYEVTSETARVIHTTISDDDGQAPTPLIQLFTVPAAGPADAGRALRTAVFTGEFTLSPDGTRVLWQITPAKLMSFSSSGPGEGTVQLNGDEKPGDPLVDPTSTYVVYEGDPGTPVEGLYRVPIDGSQASENLTRSLAGFFENEVITPDGSRIVYAVRGDSTDGRWDLYSSSLVPASDSREAEQRRARREP